MITCNHDDGTPMTEEEIFSCIQAVAARYVHTVRQFGFDHGDLTGEILDPHTLSHYLDTHRPEVFNKAGFTDPNPQRRPDDERPNLPADVRPACG